MKPKQKLIKVFETVKKDYASDIAEKGKICEVIKDVYGNDCTGCPLYYNGKRCSSMKTYPANSGYSPASFSKRETFFNEAIKILEKFPEESFKKENQFGILFDLDEEMNNK